MEPALKITSVLASAALEVRVRWCLFHQGVCGTYNAWTLEFLMRRHQSQHKPLMTTVLNMMAMAGTPLVGKCTLASRRKQLWTSV